MEAVRIVVEARAAGLRIDQAMHVYSPGFSRTFWAGAVRAGAVRLDGRQVRPSHPAPAGSLLEVDLRALGVPELLLDPAELGPPLYRSPHFAAWNKPAGLLTHPVGRIVRRSASVLAELATGAPVFPCHRLDKYTSGVLVLGCSSEAAAWAGEQLAARWVGKVYLALTAASPREDAFEVDRPLGRTGAEHVKLKMLPSDEGKPARTLFRVLERHPAGTLLECRPLTGRQHQIRAHLDLVGLPILHDLLYGPGEDWEHFDTLDERKHAKADGLWHGLHCARMELPAGPFGGDLVFEAPPTGGFAATLEAWRRRG